MEGTQLSQSQLLLYSHDLRYTWEEQLKKRGAAMAEFVGYHKERNLTLIAATISDWMHSTTRDILESSVQSQDEGDHDELSSFIGRLWSLSLDTSPNPRPGIVQCQLKSIQLKKFFELFSEPLNLLSKMLSQDIASRADEEVELEVLFGTLLCVEAYASQWFRAESSTYTIIQASSTLLGGEEFHLLKRVIPRKAKSVSTQATRFPLT